MGTWRSCAPLPWRTNTVPRAWSERPRGGKADQLGPSDSRGIEHFEDSPVVHAEESGDIGAGQCTVFCFFGALVVASGRPVLGLGQHQADRRVERDAAPWLRRARRRRRP